MILHGVEITQLRTIPDDRGYIKHILKKSELDDAESFGEVYLACIFPNVVKGWHLHTYQTQNYVCLKGNIKLVMYDKRSESPTYQQLQEIYLGELNHIRVKIPFGICNGYIATGNQEAWVLNVSDLEHSPTEMKRIEPWNDGEINYNWAVTDR